MIRKCCICGKVYGRKKPFRDKSVTHGYCEECCVVELEKVNEIIKRREEMEGEK